MFFIKGDEMKTLYIIGGPMGIGKTTVCNLLKKKLDKAVFLDGDWCWDAYPFQVTDETKKMVMDNICYILNNFLKSTAYENIVFCWVLHKKNIIENLLKNLDTDGCRIKCISLVCSADVLKKRLNIDIAEGKRPDDILEKSLNYLPMYSCLDTYKIDVTDLSPMETAHVISECSC